MQQNKKEFIHRFTITLKRKVLESTDSTNEKMEKVTVTKEIEKEIPVDIYIKNPSRALKEEGDMFYSSVFSNCLRRGIFSEAMLAKQFKEIGTTLSEEEKTRYRGLIVRYSELENDIQRASLEKNDAAKKEAIVEQTEIRDELIDFRSAQNALFNNTADTIARNKTILWYELFLAHYDKDGKIVPMFAGADFEEKINSFDKLEEASDEIFLAAQEELMSFITFWYLGLVRNTEDFTALKKTNE